MSPKIRPIAIGVFRQANKIFVFEGYDSVKDEVFYRPVGGGIEFGEHRRQALVREMQEEFAADITNLRHRATVENIFTNDGQPGHEIVFIYEAEFVDPAMYEEAVIMGKEDDGSLFRAVWKPLTDFQNDGPPLYPDGLLELLAIEERQQP
ncbi:MAG TPA: NUDIX hydrolase [Anaerolineae bacterium]|jgi:ADP-ribose pyrophosphatase YjhB (NUDIX family)